MIKAVVIESLLVNTTWYVTFPYIVATLSYLKLFLIFIGISYTMLIYVFCISHILNQNKLTKLSFLFLVHDKSYL